MVGQGGPGKPRKKRSSSPAAGKDNKNKTTSLYAPVEIMQKLTAAGITYKDAFLTGAAVKLSEPRTRTLAKVEREILIIDMAIFDFLEKKGKLIQERELLISRAIKEAESEKEEAL